MTTTTTSKLDSITARFTEADWAEVETVQGEVLARSTFRQGGRLQRLACYIYARRVREAQRRQADAAATIRETTDEAAPASFTLAYKVTYRWKPEADRGRHQREEYYTTWALAVDAKERLQRLPGVQRASVRVSAITVWSN